jgi:polysaccharide biosynthesis protein PslH
MKKTLLICGHYPLPENIGSNIRTMNFVRFFLQYGTVDIAYSHISPEVQNGNPIFSHEYFLKRIHHTGYKKYLLWFTKRLPIPIYDYSDTSHDLLISTIQSNDYDYILVRYIINTSCLFKLPTRYKMRTLVDCDDILSGALYETVVGIGKGLYKRFLHSINKKFLHNYEKKNCLNFGASLFCSEMDKRKIVGVDNKNNTFVIPNIYHNESFKDYNFEDGFQKGNTLLFIGTLNYKPNIDGLKWFIESVFNDFKKKYSDAKLLVVGRSPIDDIKKLCKSINGIELHGNPPDIKEYYQKCRAVVVPLLTGGGTRIKILEAALANRPILSTPLGAEGLNLHNDNHLLLFERPEDFANQYKKLFNKETYELLVCSAKKHVLTHYSLKGFNETMEKVLNVLESRSILFK